MNIAQGKPTFWKYELTVSYTLLMLQYLYILVFGDNINHEIAKQYVELFFYDMMLFFPVIFLVFFPQIWRQIIFAIILIGGLIYFFEDLGLDSIVFNTFISLFIANKFLLIQISEDQKDSILKFRFLKIFLLFPVIVITLLTEYFLEYLGITHPIKTVDGTVMTNYGRFIFFGGFYGGLAYFAFKEDRNKNSKTFINN